MYSGVFRDEKANRPQRLASNAASLKTRYWLSDPQTGQARETIGKFTALRYRRWALPSTRHRASCFGRKPGEGHARRGRGVQLPDGAVRRAAARRVEDLRREHLVIEAAEVPA